MAQRLGIGIGLWDEPPLAGGVVPPQPPPMPPLLSEPNLLAADLAVEIRLNARARLHDQIRRLAAERLAAASDRDRLEIEKLELAATKELGRLSGRDLTQAQVVGSPYFVEVRDQLGRGLARRQLALSEAIVALDPEGPSRVAELYRDFPLECAEVDRADAALLAAVDAARAAITAGRTMA